jgi:ADP-dependent glucokinase
LILSAVDLFRQLNLSPSASAEASGGVNCHIINDLDQFRSCFKHFFRKGSAAERSFANETHFEYVVNASVNVRQKDWFIGGNAALMAQGLAKRSKTNEILLIGPIGPKLKELLNENIQVPAGCLIGKDEVHLILEYNENDKLENVIAPHSNRFIVSHDVYNSKLQMLDEFFRVAATFRPDVIVLSGLHLLESQNEQFRYKY